MNELLTSSFWFSMRGEMTSATRFLFVGFLLLFVGYLLYLKYTEKIWKKTIYKKINRAVLSLLLVNLVFGLYLWFVFEEQVPMLSARIWLIIWFAEIFLWSMNILKAVKIIPVIKTELANRRSLRKYIP